MGNLIDKPQQNLEYHVLADQEETFTCEICIEPVALTNKFTNSNECLDHSFCTDCMIKYIQVKLEDNVPNINCPATSCNNYLEHLLCRPQIPNQLFDKWCDALCESTVLVSWHVGSTCEENIDENDAGIDVRYATNEWRMCPKCGDCIERDSGGDNIILCRCGYSFCDSCGKEAKVMCVHGSEANMWMVSSLLCFTLIMLYVYIYISDFTY